MNTSAPYGKFIALEGIEGCGKTSVRKYLETVLADLPLFFTREPDDVHMREFIMKPSTGQYHWHTQFLLFCADRAEHVAKFIAPKRAAGVHVISDRFDGSSFAIQVPYEREDAIAYFSGVTSIITRNARPDAYIYFDVPAEVGRMRALARNEAASRFDVQPLEWYEHVRKGYEQFFEEEVPGKMYRIDATKPLEVVCKEAEAIVRRLLTAP
jgi:dTMP kinase